jgi:hypothetical protein
MSQAADDQRRLIVDQFTRQAEPFAHLPAHSTDQSIRLVVEAAGIGPEDTILDVACGPGLRLRTDRPPRHGHRLDPGHDRAGPSTTGIGGARQPLVARR